MRRFLVSPILLAVIACRPQPSQDPAAPTPAQSQSQSQTQSPRTDHPVPETFEPEPTPPVARETGRLAGITAAHNRVRASLRIGHLTWSPELASFAQAWADTLARQKCRLKHRPATGADAQKYGEKIFSMTGDTPTADDVVASWAAEAQGYDARTGRCKGVCGHYTQVVWRDSQRLGCGMAACGDTEVWVCNYDPRGNYQGQRPY